MPCPRSWSSITILQRHRPTAGGTLSSIGICGCRVCRSGWVISHGMAAHRKSQPLYNRRGGGRSGLKVLHPCGLSGEHRSRPYMAVRRKWREIRLVYRVESSSGKSTQLHLIYRMIGPEAACATSTGRSEVFAHGATGSIKVRSTSRRT